MPFAHHSLPLVFASVLFSGLFAAWSPVLGPLALRRHSVSAAWLEPRGLSDCWAAGESQRHQEPLGREPSRLRAGGRVGAAFVGSPTVALYRRRGSGAGIGVQQAISKAPSNL